MKASNLGLLCVYILVLIMPMYVMAHDTTHIHPLITKNISDLIKSQDTTNKSCSELYITDNITGQRICWGTDLDPTNFANTPYTPVQYYEKDDTVKTYNHYNNVIDGVVNEDVPVYNVFNHFYQAPTGAPLSITLLNSNIVPSKPSDQVTMAYFNEAVKWMSGYDTLENVNAQGLGINLTAKALAFFTFGKALHHVEDMMISAHIHNDAENALFVPVLCCGQLKNTHVLAYTLRFLNHPRLVLKQTGSFSGVTV